MSQYDGPMGIFEDFKGCDSGIDTTPTNSGKFEMEDMEDEMDNQDLDESMDGDAASALASAGFGTDEDYSCFDGGEDW